MEKIIGEDVNDDRTKKMKERFDHYLAQQVAVVMTPWSSISGVHTVKMEVTTSWTRTPMNLTTGPTTRVSDD